MAATGNAPGPTWLAGPASTTLHALDGWPPRSAGTGARFSAHEIASALTGHRREGAQPRQPCSPPVGSVPVSFTPRPELFAGGREPPSCPGPVNSRPVADGPAQSSKACAAASRSPARGLIFGLIHPRPGPFVVGREGHVCARRGRWRTMVNAGQQCWKACWVQALASSNLASSATLTCKNARSGRSRTRVSPTRGLICWAHFRAAEGAASDLSRRGRPWSGPSRTVADGPERRGARRQKRVGQTSAVQSRTVHPSDRLPVSAVAATRGGYFP